MSRRHLHARRRAERRGASMTPAHWALLDALLAGLSPDALVTAGRRARRLMRRLHVKQGQRRAVLRQMEASLR